MLNRNHKDRLFKKIFEEKKNALSLYNALNNSDYTNYEDIEITTVDDVVYMGMKNDVSFIFDSKINMYEQQSTYNPNMPLRALLYIAQQYEKFIAARDYNFYGTKALTIPTPKVVMFYNGTKKMPDTEMLSLIDLMEFPEESDLDLKVKVVNLNNFEHNSIVKNCEMLYQYSAFTNMINDNIEYGFTTQEAVDNAVNKCISSGILKDILLSNKSEVVKMILTEYDEAKTMQAIYRDGHVEGKEEGRAEGRAEGKAEGKAEGIKETELRFLSKLLMSMTPEEIVDNGFFDEETLQKLQQEL